MEVLKKLCHKTKKMKKYGKAFMKGTAMAGFAAILFSAQVFAAGSGTSVITSSFNNIYNVIAAIVSSIGQLYLLWGVFEWATSLNTQDGTAQSMAFKRISAGLVAILAPQIITLIKP